MERRPCMDIMERRSWMNIMEIIGINRGKLMTMSEEEFKEVKMFAYECGYSPYEIENYEQNNRLNNEFYDEHSYNINDDKHDINNDKSIINEENIAYVKAEQEQLALQRREEEENDRAEVRKNRMKNKIDEYSKIGENKNGKIEVMLKFPNNSKLIKRFNSSSLSNDLYLCALSKKESWNEDSTEKHILVKDPIGRVINSDKSLRDSGIAKRTVLIIEYD